MGGGSASSSMIQRHDQDENVYLLDRFGLT
jgi:hypothetical protein